MRVEDEREKLGELDAMLDVVEPGFLQELPLPPRRAEKGLLDIFKDVEGADNEEGKGM